jgi:D-threonate/D-erythronate kinase
VNESPTPLIGIFADDLTGALDAAAPFAARGFRTVVSAGADLPEGTAGAEVVSINLGTRHMDPAEIEAQITGSVKALVDLGAKVLLNKVDSTLRGNPGVELLVALKALDADHAVLCSAYPQNKRTVEQGVLLVDGVPVSDTEVGQDKLSPLSSSYIEMIVNSALERAGAADQVHVRGTKGGAAISDFLPVIVTADASTDDDLRVMAERLVTADSTAIVAGSAGVSVALASVLDDSRRGQTPPVGLVAVGKRLLIVTASQREIVDAQIRALGDRIDWAQVEVSADEIFRGISSDSIDRIVALTEREGVVILKLGKLGDSGNLETSDLRTMAATIVQNLGQVVRAVTDKSSLDVLVVIGGDTSSGVLEACGVRSLELQGELQPGTVSGVPVGGSIAGKLLVTRAGGFGDEKSLLELVSMLQFGHGV